MANFLLSLSTPPQVAQDLFNNGLRINAVLKKQAVLAESSLNNAHAAVFARSNGTGGEIVSNPNGAFLLASGTWLHRDGYGNGSAARLFQRFLEVGAERLAQELEGFFFVAASSDAAEVAAITDIVGSHHAFVRQLDGAVVLSGSSAVLAALAPYTLDEIACQEFIRTGIIYEDRTVYQEVRKLPPASVLYFRDGKLKHRSRYWDPRQLASMPVDREEAVDALHAAGVTLARRLAALYPRRLCDLTGGYDSRALAALLLDAEIEFDTTVSGPDDSADVKISRGLANLAGLKHTQRRRRNDLSFEDIEAAFCLTDGEYDLVEYANIMKTHRQHSQDYDVSMNGSYGEVARGYWWELLVPNTGRRAQLNSERIARKRYAAAAKGGELFTAEKKLDLTAHFTAILSRNNAGFEQLPNTLQLDHSYLMLRMQRWQGRIASSTDQIWPCVSPFMFRSILEIMLRAQPCGRRRSLLVRAMLARFNPAWAAYPLEHGYPAEPFGLRNAWRFLPLLKFFTGKALTKVGSRFGVLRSPRPAAEEPLYAALMRDLKAASLLDPARMLSAQLYDENRLGAMIKPSEAGLSPALWSRVLSLEYALRASVQESIG